MNIEKELIDIKNNLRNSLLKYIEDYYRPVIDQKIVIYGTGNYGKFIYSILKNINPKADIKCFCYTDGCSFNSQNIDEYYDLPVITASEAVNRYGNSLFVIASSYSNEIIKNVTEKKYDIKIIFDPDLNFWQQIYKRTFSFDTKEPKWLENFSYYYLKLNSKLDNKLQEIKNILDEDSFQIINNRINFFKTGDFNYFKKIHCTELQYFSESIWALSDNEVLFDCGAFNGDTIENFNLASKGKYQKILSFEPCKNTFDELSRYVSENRLSNVKLINAGVSSKTEQLLFEELPFEEASSRFIDKKEDVQKNSNITTVNTVALDDFLSEKPTLIKMDIEGFELNALKGAQNIIRSYKPKLAICIYHKPEDVFEIIHYIRSLEPQYKFKVKHHSGWIWETVLYAYII